MNIKKWCNKFFIGFIMISMSMAVMARDFILKNDSNYSIYVRNRSNEEAAQNIYVPGENHTLMPGVSITLDDKYNYSIKTAGESLTAQFYNVPLKDLLQASAKANQALHFNNLALYIPVVVVSSGYTYGWYFKLNWQKK